MALTPRNSTRPGILSGPSHGEAHAKRGRRVRRLAVLLAPLAVFGTLVAVLTLVDRGPSAPTAAPVSLESKAAELAALGDTTLDRARATGDPAEYTRAERAYAAALRRAPRDVGAVLGAGTLANLRHDFREGLRLGRRARALGPELVQPYVVLADAQIELGRYDAALASIQRLVDRRPGLAAYARASYYRELTGDRDGAIAAMRLAISAGGVPENIAYVHVLLGDLQLAGGHLDRARRAYRTALAAVPDYPQGLAGLARAALAGGGDTDVANARLRRSTARLPLTTNLTLLAEAQHVAGDRRGAATTLAVVRAQHRLLAGAGTAPDAERVLVEANHGSPARAVALGREVWRAAPSVRSADALGWALTRAGRRAEGLRWARRALRLGSVDPAFRLHAAIAAGASAEGRRDLRIAATGKAALSPLDQRRLAEALR